MHSAFFKQFHLLIQENEYQKALDEVNNALKKNEESPDLIGLKGVALFHLKDIECLKYLDKAILLEPNNGYRYSSRAFIKDILGDTEAAILDYQQAITLDPQDHIAYNNLGMLEEKLGRNQQAQHRFEQADTLAGVPRKEKYAFPPTPITKDNIPSSKWHVVKQILTNKKEWNAFITFVKGKVSKN